MLCQAESNNDGRDDGNGKQTTPMMGIAMVIIALYWCAHEKRVALSYAMSKGRFFTWECKNGSLLHTDPSCPILATTLFTKRPWFNFAPSPLLA